MSHWEDIATPRTQADVEGLLNDLRGPLASAIVDGFPTVPFGFAQRRLGPAFVMFGPGGLTGEALVDAGCGLFDSLWDQRDELVTFVVVFGVGDDADVPVAVGDGWHRQRIGDSSHLMFSVQVPWARDADGRARFFGPGITPPVGRCR